MFCIKCGTELPEEANFCWKCGKPQKEGVEVEEPKWETCQIVYDRLREIGFLLTKPAQDQFWAKAIGPEGSYSAGDSPVFETWSDYPSSLEDEPVGAHKALIKKLVGDGWEPTGDKGASWWSDRFRRRVK